MSSMVTVGGKNGSCYWNMRFIHNFHDLEMEGVYSLMDLFYDKLPFAGGTDCVICILNSNGVWSYYEHFRNASWKLFTRRCIWSSYVPKKVSFFVETALLYKILTIDNLIKRNIPLVNCCMCKANNE